MNTHPDDLSIDIEWLIDEPRLDTDFPIGDYLLGRFEADADQGIGVNDAIQSVVNDFIAGPRSETMLALLADYADWAESTESNHPASMLVDTFEAGVHFMPSLDASVLAGWLLGFEGEGDDRGITDLELARYLRAIDAGSIDPASVSQDDCEQQWVDYFGLPAAEQASHQFHRLYVSLDAEYDGFDDLDVARPQRWAERFHAMESRQTRIAVRQGDLPESAEDHVDCHDYLLNTLTQMPENYVADVVCKSQFDVDVWEAMGDRIAVEFTEQAIRVRYPDTVADRRSVMVDAVSLDDPKRRKTCITALVRLNDWSRPKAGAFIDTVLTATDETAKYVADVQNGVVYDDEFDEFEALSVVLAYAGVGEAVEHAVDALMFATVDPSRFTPGGDLNVAWDGWDWSTMIVDGETVPTGLPSGCDDPLRIAKRLVKTAAIDV